MTENLDFLQASDLIGNQLKITIKDGRRLTGILLALDNKPNLLVNNVIEHTDDGAGSERQRELGLVSVAVTSLEKVEILKEDLDKTVEWKSKLLWWAFCFLDLTGPQSASRFALWLGNFGVEAL